MDTAIVHVCKGNLGFGYGVIPCTGRRIGGSNVDFRYFEIQTCERAFLYTSMG